MAASRREAAPADWPGRSDAVSAAVSSRAEASCAEACQTSPKPIADSTAAAAATPAARARDLIMSLRDDATWQRRLTTWFRRYNAILALADNAMDGSRWGVGDAAFDPWSDAERCVAGQAW